MEHLNVHAAKWCILNNIFHTRLVMWKRYITYFRIHLEIPSDRSTEQSCCVCCTVAYKLKPSLQHFAICCFGLSLGVIFLCILHKYSARMETLNYKVVNS